MPKRKAVELESKEKTATSGRLPAIDKLTDWQYYEGGDWHSFGENSVKRIRQALSENDPAIFREPEDLFKKKSSQRRIRCDDTDSDSGLGFYILSNSLFQKIKKA
eukprot:gene24472-29576_t